MPPGSPGPKRAHWRAGLHTRLALGLLAAALIGLPVAPSAAPQTGGQGSRPDFDIRDGRPAVPARATVDDAARDRGQGTGRERRRRLNRESGSVRVLEDVGLSAPRNSPNAAIRALLVVNASRLGLERRDLNALILVRDYTSQSTGLRHVLFRQTVDGLPVFDSSITVHLLPDGTIARITSNAASTDGRVATAAITAGRAQAEAASHAGNTVDAAGPASGAWLPVDGVLRLAWHVVVPGVEGSDLYDILIDAQNAELLLRRNRVRDAEGSGRVLQGPGTAARDPRLPDAMPFGADGTLACPPPVNYTLRSLNSQYRDPATVLDPTGRLEGNNTRVYRGSANGQSAQGTFDGSTWLFDFPFNSASSAETFLFFAVNFAHDFFYDLGFDEAAGNFQVDNFGRGGLGGDPLRANARAAGRNNANYVHATEGHSPTINMFLWDGIGCWGEDLTGDGTADIDGDYDLDITIHEFHHGVSMRLNTAFSGNETGAIGEGGGDFFAYSVNNDTTLAEYARPGGLRQVNSKGYGDWTCRLGLFCEVHENGEIWVNTLWDVRERFRADVVRGNEGAAINESHQLYIDGLKLSPPHPTMLDMRDAMLQADAIRNPWSPTSENFCRLWESFAGRGMGVSATDTADNGGNRVGPAYDVPNGCQAPTIPLLVTITATTPTALEAGPVSGAVTVSRGSAPTDLPLTVNYALSGTAVAGSDYVLPPGSVTIPAGAAEATVPIDPIDDVLVEGNETVTVNLASGSGYAIGTPAFATVTIVSDDVLPDLVVTALTSSQVGGPGGTIQVTDTTRNQGTGAAGPSQTSFYLSRNALFETTDALLGSRSVGDLPTGSASSGGMSLVLPTPLESGTYYLFAKADGPGAIIETNEFNNLRITTIAIGPDLTVTALTAPALAGAGGSIVVSDTTTNQGGGLAPASATRFYLSANVFFDASDTPLEARNVPGLAVGASSIGSTTVTIPAGTAAGSYYLFAQADAGAAVTEANELNNTRSTLLRVGADLTVSALSAPARGAAGSTIGVTDTTRNVGGGSATPSSTAFYLSTNLTLDASDIRLQPARPVPGLAVNELSTATTQVMLPDVAAGTWYLIANADEGNAVPEAIETNNVRFTTLQIGPDLAFVGITMPSSGVSGASITVSDTVRNIGAADAPATEVRFYLSTNAVLDAGDIPLNAVRSVLALAAGASSTGSTSVPLPTGMSGSFYLIIVADGGQAVAESSELNNTAPRLIQISPGS